MSENCDVIVIFPVYGQFGAIQKPDSGRIVCKTYVFINSNLFFLTKTKNRTIAKNADISRIKRALVLKSIFSETRYVCLLTCQI